MTTIFIVPWIIYIGLFMGLMFFLWRNQARRGPAAGVLTFGRSRGRVIHQDDIQATFDDVAGVDEAKEELQEVVDFLKHPEKYRRIGARIPKGVLLVGPPGTGKTLLAKAVAGEAGVPFISMSGSEFVEMFVGVGAARVRDLFQQAGQQAPCIIFIDELDALGRSRGGASGLGSNEEREQTLNQLLVEMDGFSSNEAVILIGATNRPEILDPALLRPGRFDRQVVVDRPDRAGRLAILQVHARGVKMDDKVDLHDIARRTPGFAGADLANLLNEAALLSARVGKELVDASTISEAIDRVIAGLKKRNLVMSEETKSRIAYHEVGHALASVLAGHEDEVGKISIVPRSGGAAGFTLYVAKDDEITLTARQIQAKLVAILGGRAAEEVVFGEPSTGAQNDLEKATDLARSMVIDFGMSNAVGPVSVGRKHGGAFLGERGRDSRRPVGHALADTIDQEIRRIVDESMEEAVALLSANRESLDHISERLLEDEVLEGEELDRLLSEARAWHRQQNSAEKGVS